MLSSQENRFLCAAINHHLGTLAAHCCTFDSDSKLGIRPVRSTPGELDNVGGRPGLMFTLLADEMDLRFVRVLP